MRKIKHEYRNLDCTSVGWDRISDGRVHQIHPAQRKTAGDDALHRGFYNATGTRDWAAGNAGRTWRFAALYYGNFALANPVGSAWSDARDGRRDVHALAA